MEAKTEALRRRFPPPPIRPPLRRDQQRAERTIKEGSSAAKETSASWRKLFVWLAFGASTVVLICLLITKGREHGMLLVIAESRELLKVKPQKAISLLEGVAATSVGNAQYFDALGDAHFFARQYSAAERHHLEALRVRQGMEQDSSELAESFLRLATDVQFENPPLALQYLHSAHRLPRLHPDVSAYLLMSEARVHECSDDFEAALQKMDNAVRVLPGLGEHSDYKRALAATLGRMVARNKRSRNALDVALQQTLETLQRSLLASGPWEMKLQMPLQYTKGLISKPWRSIEDEAAPAWSHTCAGIVKRVVDSLRTEYASLQDSGLLRRQTECISSHRSGAWLFFEIGAPWEDLGEDNCSTASPVACKLFHELHAAGMPLVRAGYSVLQAGSHLWPHMGKTNEELKWHVGLLVPSQPPSCATIRVANEIRAYSESGILFFDDSYEHEVWNQCDSERVVFQLVFRHPDLAQKGG